MICKKCGKDIQEAHFCPDCGESAEALEQGNAVQPKKKLNGKLLAAGAVCAAAAVAVGAFFFFKPEDRVEHTVNEVYEVIQEDLLDPDSLQLRSMYIQFYEDDDGLYGANVSVTFTAGTRGGGVTDGEAIVYIHEDGDNSVTYAHSDSELAAASDSETVTMNFTNYLVAETKLKIVQDPDVVKLSKKEIEAYLD